MDKEKPLLIDTGKGFTIKYQGKYLYSSLDPLGSVNKQLHLLTLEANTVYLVPSVGLGYGLAELLVKLPASSFILCVEKDPELMQLALTTACQPLPRSPQLVILRTDDPSHASRLLYKQGVGNFRRIQMVPFCAGFRLYPEFYTNLEKVLESEIRTFWQNKMTLIHMGKLWIKNIFANLPLLARSHSLSELKTIAPIVVAGAGPSLEGNLAWLKAARAGFLLLATDTALPVLGDYGLKPDFVFMLESQLANLYDFIDYPFFDVPLLCDLSSNPLIVRLFKGKVFFFASRFYPLHLLERLDGVGLVQDWLPPLGSVGVSAVEVALRITTGPVILTGLDFSYAGKKTHARGAPFPKLLLRNQQRLAPAYMAHLLAFLSRPLITTTGKQAQPLLTDLVLATYAERLREVVGNGKQQVFDIGQVGLLTGAQGLTSYEELANVLRNSFSPEQPTPACSIGDAATSPSLVQEKRVKARAFIRQELSSLQAAGAFIRDNLSRVSDQDEARHEAWQLLSPEERELLEGLDYLYYYFPDKSPLGNMSRSFLARLQQSATYFLKIIEQVKL
jgi:hypothetical protein